MSHDGSRLLRMLVPYRCQSHAIMSSNRPSFLPNTQLYFPVPIRVVWRAAPLLKFFPLCHCSVLFTFCYDFCCWRVLFWPAFVHVYAARVWRSRWPYHVHTFVIMNSVVEQLQVGLSLVVLAAEGEIRHLHIFFWFRSVSRIIRDNICKYIHGFFRYVTNNQICEFVNLFCFRMHPFNFFSVIEKKVLFYFMFARPLFIFQSAARMSSVVWVHSRIAAESLMLMFFVDSKTFYEVTALLRYLLL